MHPGTDPSVAPPSFATRRPAANNLPIFELPPPPSALNSKYQPFAAINATNPTPSSGSIASVGNLLTPPNTIPSENLSPVSSGMQNGSGSNQAAYSAYWSQQNQPQYPYPTGSTPQWIPPRGLFSPASGSLNSMVRGRGSPTSADGISHQGSEMGILPSFQTSLSMSAPTTLPAMAQSHMMNGQSGMAATSQASPMAGHEAFHNRPGPNHNYYGASPPSSTSPQQGPFGYSSGPSPTVPSPAGASQPRMSPHSPANGDMQSLPSNMAHGANGYSRPYGQYSLPAMGGPVMSNLHSPNGQMSLVGGMSNSMIPGFNSGHAASMQQMYGMPHHSAQQQQPPNDRPFKCDVCVQSFNRNHDLKRHKRIHLAVKPYPCGHCDKSFSRKDALKRHILVKGCGKTGTGESDDHDRSVSPTTKPNEDGRRSATSSDS